MKRYLLGSCISDKISWISHTKCQFFIGQEIYEGSFIFHVIYFNFILSFLLKNKITHGEIWLVENFFFYISSSHAKKVETFQGVHIYSL
jgi:hypothetical protein